MKKELRDQLLHAAGGATPVGLAFIFGPVTFIQAVIISLAPGIAREVTEWMLAPPGHGHPWSRGSLIDYTGWVGGGVAMFTAVVAVSALVLHFS